MVERFIANNTLTDPSSTSHGVRATSKAIRQGDALRAFERRVRSRQA
jgi:hypothetical protein